MKRMSNTLTLQPISSRITALVIVLFSLLSAGCGLNEQERTVSEVNGAIRSVEETGSGVAAAIAAQEGTEGTRDVERLSEAVQTYMASVDELNAHMRELTEVMPAMNEHIRGEFMPKAEEAATACQQALDLLQNSEQVDDVVLRDAITRLGVCIDQYAHSVTRVSTMYSQVSD